MQRTCEDEDKDQRDAGKDKECQRLPARQWKPGEKHRKDSLSQLWQTNTTYFPKIFEKGF